MTPGSPRTSLQLAQARPPARRRGPALAAGGLVFGLMLSGCVSRSQIHQVIGPSYRPDNIHCIYPLLPDTIRRVAVLPITVEANDWQAAREREHLQSVLNSEFGKAKKFELVAVSPEQLREWTGGSAWPAAELLPSTLLSEIERQLGCDAVLFSHLRPFHAYKPMVMGWTLRLVECQNQQIFWSADEVFDASDERVVRAAQKYSQQHGESWWQPLADPASILSSPRRFSHYTLSALFATLPGR